MEPGWHSHLLAPDGRALLSGERAADPLALAGASALALIGAGLFGTVTLLAVGPVSDPAAGIASALGDVPALLAAPALATILTWPPLYLVHALGQRAGGAQELLAAVSVGPAVCGAWLLAGTPLLLLYALTGTANAGFVVLAALLAGLALWAGGIASAKVARANPTACPRVAVLAVHYVLFFWTAGVLAVHLT